jgi:hypothetical protein
MPCPVQVRVEGELAGQGLHPAAQLAGEVVGELATQRGGDDVGDLAELGGSEAAGGQGRGADAQPRGDHRRARVEGDGVAVDRDADPVQPVLGLLTVQLRVAQVDQDQVHLGAAGQHRDPGLLHVVGHQPAGEHPGAVQRPLLALPELLGRRDLERDRLGRDHVLERPALLAGEDGAVDFLGQVSRAEDDAAPGTAQRLVRGRGDHVGVRHGVGVQAGGDQTGEVRHVDQEVGAHQVGDAAELGEVEVTGVGRPAGDDHLRPVLAGEPLHLVHVHA